MLFVVAVLGLIAGSFVNATVWRLHMQELEGNGRPSRKKRPPAGVNTSILTGRSVCTSCGHRLAPFDLIPVLSFLYLGGRCRYCHKPIEDTPLAEVATAVLFAVSYAWWPYSLAGNGLTLARFLLACWLVCIVGFVILALYDFKWMLLPDRVTVPLAGLAILQVLVAVIAYRQGSTALAQAVLGVVVLAGLFYLLHSLSRGAWLGFGDVKLAAVLGLLVGGPLPVLLLLLVASVAGSLAALPLIIRGKPIAKTRIPFGPFLLLGAVITTLFGSHIIAWYLSILHVGTAL